MAPSLLDARGPITPSTAADHTLLDTDPSLPLFRYYLDADPTKAFWSFGAQEFLGTIAAVRYRVLEGAGVAVLPRYFVRDAIERRRSLQALPGDRLSTHDYFRLIWVEDQPLDDEILGLADQLRAITLR